MMEDQQKLDRSWHDLAGMLKAAASTSTSARLLYAAMLAATLHKL